MLQRIALFVAQLVTLSTVAQFGGPYAIMASDQHGVLRNTPGLLANYMAFHHMAGPAVGGSNLQVTSILVDDHETYWLGTATGLLRLDGDRQLRYLHDPQESNSLPNDHVTDVVQDGAGQLWIATRNGLCRMDPRTGSIVRVPLAAEGGNELLVANLVKLEFRFGKIWCSSWDGHFTVDPTTMEFKLMQPTARLDRPPKKNGTFINALMFPADGTHPMLGTTEGLFRLDPRSGQMRPLLPTHVSLTIQPSRLFPASDGRFWCYDRHSELVLLMDTLVGVLDTLPQLGQRSSYHQLLGFHQHKGILWVCFGDGSVHAIETSTNRSYKVQFGPVASTIDGSVTVNALKEDRRGRLWMGTNAGLIVLLPADPGSSLEEVPELEVEGSIMYMAVDPQGFLLLGTRGAGIRWRDPSTGEWHVVRDTTAEIGSKAHSRRNTIFGITPMGPTDYVVATLGGPARFDRLTGKLTKQQVQDELLARTYTVSCEMAPDGHVWFSTMSDGVFEVDVTSWTVLRHFTIADSVYHIPGHGSGAIHCERDGTVWMGLQTGTGLVRLSPGRNSFEVVMMPDGLPLGQVVSVETRMPDRILISTHWDGAAIIHRKEDRLVRISLADGLPGVQLRAIVGHPEFGIWIGGRNGVAKLSADGERVVAADIRLGRDHYAGIIALDTCLRKLWIADGPRLLVLELDSAKHAEEGLQLALLDIRLNGQPMSNDLLPALRAHHDRLVFVLSVQDPLLAMRARIAYRLGPDMPWEECVGCREIVFADLPAGDHQLELRVSDTQGLWGPPQVMATFTVLPPFWHTWWSRVLLVVFIGAIGLVFFRWRLAQRMATVRALFANERALTEERLRIANDLHDELGSGLSVIKVKSELALERPDDHPPAETLRQVADTSIDLIHGIRQIIWTIRSGQLNLSDLLAYMRGYAVGYLSDHGIACSFETPANLHDRALTAEQRRALLLIMKEALHNVVKHAQATRVSIVFTNGDRLSMRIADNGQGFTVDPECGEGLGMASMKKRATLLGGSLHVERTEDTIILLDIPWPEIGPNVSSQKSS